MTPDQARQAAEAAINDERAVDSEGRQHINVEALAQHFARFAAEQVAAERLAIIQGLRRQAAHVRAWDHRDARTRALALEIEADAMESKSEWRGEKPTHAETTTRGGE